MADFKKPTQGRVVDFFPSDRMKDTKFPQNKQSKKKFAAIIDEVNENSIDVHVFAGRQIVFCGNIPHKSETEEKRSHWDWPVIEGAEEIKDLVTGKK